MSTQTCERRTTPCPSAGTLWWAGPLILVLFCAPFARSQTGSAPAIRVESGAVLIPCIVCTKSGCRAVPGLTPVDFHLFEDGKEQQIQRVSIERMYAKNFKDNFGAHDLEWATAPEQKWSILGILPNPPFTLYGMDLYVLVYAAAPSTAGSCHSVKVAINRKQLSVFSRTEYCNAQHAPSDPLTGTTLSDQMEIDAVSKSPGKIPLSSQVGFFYPDAKTARAHVTVEFPQDSIKFPNGPGQVADQIAVLTMVYGKDGALVARTSDLDEETFMYEDDKSRLERDPVDFDASWRNVYVANHHEAQIDLPPGAYDVRVIVTDGHDFGRAEIPLTVDGEGDHLGISSVFICKQFHDPNQWLYKDPSWTRISQSESPPSSLANFVPLVSKGMEFTPAGDTDFSKGFVQSAHVLYVYYEIYEPLLASVPATTVQTRVRIISIKTGELMSDTGVRSAADWIEIGKPVIHVSQQIVADKLPKGSYRIEVQASDSAGRSTAWRIATFAIE